MGVSILAGYAVMAVFIPTQRYVATTMGRIRRATVPLTSKRTSAMNEVLGGIKLIKVSGVGVAGVNSPFVGLGRQRVFVCFVCVCMNVLPVVLAARSCTLGSLRSLNLFASTVGRKWSHSVELPGLTLSRCVHSLFALGALAAVAALWDVDSMVRFGHPHS